MKKVLCLLFLPVCLISAEFTLALDLTLDQAVAISLKNNLGIQLQKEQVVSSSEKIESTLGEFDTVFSADAAMGATKNSAVLSGEESDVDLTAITGELAKKFSTGTELSIQAGNSREENDPDIYLIDPAHSTNFGVTVNQPLLYGRGTQVQTAFVEAARKQFQAEEYLVESQAADLAAAVKNAYWELVYSWQDIEVQKLSLSLAAKLVEETRLQIEAGRLAKIEIFQPESEVARREQQLITGERAIGVAEDTLKILLNSQNWSQNITAMDTPNVGIVSIDLDNVMESALANRQDLLAAKSQTSGAEILAVRKKNHTLPRLGLYGTAGIGASGDEFGNSYSNINDDTDQQWQLGINFSMPLENRYAEGEYRRALSTVRKTKLQTEILRQEIRRKVRSTVRDVELATKAIEATRKTTLATAKRLEAEQAKFDAGKSTTFDVLAAQESYARTLSDEYRAKVVYVQSLAEIDRVQGVIRRNVRN